MDQANERARGKNQIGTTGRGIGPTYADKMNRIGIRIQDLFDPEGLAEKVEAALAPKNEIFAAVGMETLNPEVVTEELLAQARTAAEEVLSNPIIEDVVRVEALPEEEAK